MDKQEMRERERERKNQYFNEKFQQYLENIFWKITSMKIVNFEFFFINVPGKNFVILCPTKQKNCNKIRNVQFSNKILIVIIINIIT